MSHLQKTKKEYKNFKETGDSRYTYQNELNKACFQHDMAHGSFKDLTPSNKILRDKAFNITKNPKYDGYQRGLASMVYKNENISNKKLAEELHKQLSENLRKEKYTHLL